MIETSDQWDVGPFRCRNIAISEYYSFILTCNLIILIGQHIHTKTCNFLGMGIYQYGRGFDQSGHKIYYIQIELKIWNRHEGFVKETPTR